MSMALVLLADDVLVAILMQAVQLMKVHHHHHILYPIPYTIQGFIPTTYYIQLVSETNGLHCYYSYWSMVATNLSGHWLA